MTLQTRPCIIRAVRRPGQRQLEILHRETDDRHSLARLLLVSRLVQRIRQMLELHLSARYFPEVPLLQHHLHLKFPCMKIHAIKLVDVRRGGGCGVHGVGEVIVVAKKAGLGLMIF